MNNGHKWKRELSSSGAAAIAAVIIAATGVLMLSTQAFTDSNTAHGDSTMTTPPTITVTPFSQINSKELNEFGLTVKDISSHNEKNNFISFQSVLNRTNQLYQNIGGTTRHIWLVSVTSQDPTKRTYRTISKQFAQGDPNLRASHNALKNIPCFLVAIHMTHGVQSAGGTPKDGGNPVIISPTGNLYILIDATNGKTLFTFSVTTHATSPMIPMVTKH